MDAPLVADPFAEDGAEELPADADEESPELEKIPELAAEMGQRARKDAESE